MPTLIESTSPTNHSVPSHYFPNAPGRRLGSKNTKRYINVRAEMEKVYKLLGSEKGLYANALTDKGRGHFYELFCKIFASFDLKDTEQTKEPIRVLVYGSDGSHIEISAPTAAPDPLPIDMKS